MTTQDLLNQKINEKVVFVLFAVKDTCPADVEWIANYMKSNSTFGPKSWQAVKDTLTVKAQEFGGMQSADIMAVVELL